MKRLAVLTLALELSFPSSALAATVQTIFATQAQGNNGSPVMLEVAPGLGLNINFIPTGEVIKKMWLDDPSRIALSFDGSLCQSLSDNQQECQDRGATVVHLRQIKPINFTALPRSATGITLLTLITEGAGGRKLYQFKLRPTAGEPKFTTLTIVPDPQKLTPILEQTPTVTSNSQSVKSNSQVAPNTESHRRQSFTQPVPFATAPPSTWEVVQSIPANPQLHSAVASYPSSVTAPATSNTSTLKQPPISTNAPALSQQQKTSPSQLVAKPEQALAKEPQSTPARNSSRGTLVTATSSPTQPVQYSAQTIEDANAAAFGLVVAKREGQINPYTATWKKAQKAISLLRQGETREKAALTAHLPVSVLTQLISWGQERP